MRTGNRLLLTRCTLFPKGLNIIDILNVFNSGYSRLQTLLLFQVSLCLVQCHLATFSVTVGTRIWIFKAPDAKQLNNLIYEDVRRIENDDKMPNTSTETENQSQNKVRIQQTCNLRSSACKGDVVHVKVQHVNQVSLKKWMKDELPVWALLFSL